MMPMHVDTAVRFLSTAVHHFFLKNKWGLQEPSGWINRLEASHKMGKATNDMNELNTDVFRNMQHLGKKNPKKS